jgi:MHS family proline/betaine transporter-like MFS transporter
MASTTAEALDARPRGAARTIVAISIGNALEWFELVVYGFLAVTMAEVFFPADDPTVSLLVTLGTFGVTFVMRPIGSVVLGALADSAGRREALTLSIALMLLGTLTIAVAPPYASIGLTAPGIVLCARLVQGFAAGGEFGSATALLAEQDPTRRGFFASWQFASQGVTTLLAAGFGAALHALLAPEELVAWGWRIPFLFGLSIGPIGLYIRRHLDEGAEFERPAAGESALRATFVDQRGRTATAVGLIVLASMLAFNGLYMPTFAVKQLGLPPAASFAGVAWLGVVQLALVPCFGILSDRVGRVPVMAGAVVGVGLAVVPLFHAVVTWPSVPTLLLVLTALSALTSAYMGPLAATMSELFPSRNRGSGLSVSYSLGVSIFGGFAPFVSAWLVGRTGLAVAPAFYVLVGVVASGFALRAARGYGVR